MKLVPSVKPLDPRIAVAGGGTNSPVAVGVLPPNVSVGVVNAAPVIGGVKSREVKSPTLL